LDLTWNYPVLGNTAEPDADAVLAEINGYDGKGDPLGSYTKLRNDGSTTCGCWIYCGVRQDGVNQAARRKPQTEQDWVALEWAWAWPDNRRIMYNRCSAKPDGSPWSERKKLVWWDAEQEKWTGLDVPDFQASKPPDYRPGEDAQGIDALSGIDPFIMQADGKGWLYVPSGLADGPLPTHYEPQDSPVRNELYRQQRSPSRMVFSDPRNRYAPDAGEAGARIYPYVATTYRLTEQFTAGGMSRWTPYLAELQPEMFCEVSPELAAERGLTNAGWATLVSPRGVIEARVLVTDRMSPLRVADRIVHQIGLPYHWGRNGLSKGDPANELSSIVLDPNSHIQEVKAFTVDIQPGRRPRGAQANALVVEYQQRAGITDKTGTEV
jgi:formate dehydrogenase major subunit